MKKIAIVLLVITMVFSASIGFAENIDLASMTLDELISMQKRVDEEIHSRLSVSFSSYNIYPGSYVVGTDIKAGTYIITGGSNIEYSALVAIFESLENLLGYVSWENYINLKEYSKQAVYVSADSDVFVSLSDGDILYLGKGSYTIKEAVAPFRP